MKIIAHILCSSLSISLIFVNVCYAQFGFSDQVLEGRGKYLKVIDFDNDEDMDIVGSSLQEEYISLWENDGNGEFNVSVIARVEDDPGRPVVIDLDSDGDNDILTRVYEETGFFWWENDGDEDFEEHHVEGTYHQSYSSFAIDLDNDDDIDVITGGNARGGPEGNLTWWINDGEQNFVENIITFNIDVVNTVYASDVDSDGDIDMLCSTTGIEGVHRGSIRWFENEGNNDFAEHVVTQNQRAIRIRTFDIDSDDDMDILNASAYPWYFVWWENDGDQNFEEHHLPGEFDWPGFVYPVDLDLDNDIDIVGISKDLWTGDPNYSYLTWWENDGQEDFEYHIISRSTSHFTTVGGGDFDCDGDVDLVCGNFYSQNNPRDPVILFENVPNIYTPGEFSPLQPLDEELYEYQDCYSIYFDWEESIDEDDDQSVRYDLHLRLSIPENPPLVKAIIPGLIEPNITLNLIDSLGLRRQADTISAEWWVEAISLADTTRCEQDFSFTIVNETGITGDLSTDIPDIFSVRSVYPNPFNSTTLIRFGLSGKSEINVSVFNIIGQKVAQLASGSYSAGYHNIVFNASEHPSGIYFIHACVAGKMDDVRKVILLR